MLPCAVVDDRQTALVAQLQTEHTLLMAVLDQIPQLLSLFRPDGERWMRNRCAAALDATPLHQSESLRYVDAEVTHLDGSPYTAADYPIGRALRGEPVVEEEFFMPSSGVKRRYASTVTPVYGGEGELLAVVCIWEDVTDRRLAEQEHARLVAELANSNRLFTGIAEATPDSIYLLDLKEGRDIYHNHSLSPILGYPLEEFEQIRIVETLVHPDDREIVKTALSQFKSIEDGRIIDFEYRMHHKNGSWLWFHSRAVLFERDENGQPRVILGVAQDVTERRRHEEVLRQAQEALTSRVAERTAQLMRVEEDTRHRIARTLHDEMGQHVSALKLGLELLADVCPDPQPVAQLLHILHGLDDHIDRLAHELRPSALEELGLTAALASYIDHYSARAGIAVDFQMAVQTEEPMSPIIESALYRIVQESLTNVLKHSQANNASVVVERHAAHVRLVIDDDGIGFDADEVMAGRDRDRRLGLTGMQERAALLNGTFNIESSKGGGTSIFVSVPL